MLNKRQEMSVIEIRREHCYLRGIPAPGHVSGAFVRRTQVLSHSADTAQDAAVREANSALHSLEGYSKTLLDQIVSTLNDEKAEDVVSINLRGKSEMADFMVIASGRSSRQVAAIAEKLTERLKQELNVFCKVEGKSAGDWVLIDAGDAIIHIFRPEVREFYQLEKMWMSPGDAVTAKA